VGKRWFDSRRTKKDEVQGENCHNIYFMIQKMCVYLKQKKGGGDPRKKDVTLKL
jgi:hypothetical protein